MKRTVARIDLQPMLLDVFIIAMKQEMHIASGVGQLPAIITSYGSCTYNCIFHKNLFSIKTGAKVIILQQSNLILQKNIR